jgi:hypothetical protein
MFRIRKSKHRRRIIKVQKSNPAADDVLEKLNSFLDATEPEPVYFLTRMWNDQQKAITYKELREAIQNGYLDEKTVQEWQNDYANFVNEHLKPIWTESMMAANAELMANHPDYFFDPMSDGVLKWTNEHAAQWVSSIGDESKEAIAAMVEHSFSGDFTVDELSRAIRPTVGLNKTQAKANLNYYKHIKESLLENNLNMKEKTAEKRARDAAQKYAAKQHRQRAFTIATTEMAFAYNKGADEGMKQAQEQSLIGKVKKVWSTAADERVCEICGGLEGKEIDMGGDFEFKGYSLYSGQKQTPPAHPRCRCAVLYVEVEPPKYKPAQESDAIEPWSQEDQLMVIDPPEPEMPAIYDGVQMPSGMKYNGKANLGGTGDIYSYFDDAGEEWLFKPAQSKSGNPEAFRAHVQEAGYKVQGIIDPDTAVPVGIGELDGKFGAFQKKVVDIDESLDLKHIQYTDGKLPPGIAAQLQREHTTDWLMGNFDSHGGNFVTNNTGKLIGLDKEQSFRYINEIGGQQMSYTYHPNATYGETEPIYNNLFRKFAKGEVDLDLQDTLTYIKRVEAIPDKEYREIFRGYAEELHGKGKAAEELLDQIVDRKGRLREDYREFYSDLLTERTGTKQAFIWADEATQHMQQPITAVMHSPETLKKMNVAELKQMAKQKQIPYYNNMNKNQLVTSISDPIKAPEMSAQVRNRLAANEAARKAAATAPVPAKPKDSIGANEVFKDLSVLPDKRIGVPIRSDGGDVEGLNLTGRRMQILDDASGGTYEIYEISGKLTNVTWSKTWDKMKPIGDSTGELYFELADDAKKLYSSKADLGASIRTMTVTDGNTSFELYIDGITRKYNGWRGYFRVRTPVTTSGAADAENIKNMLQKLELDGLLMTPDAQAETILKKTRLVWQHAPNRIHELDTLKPEEIPAKLDMIIKEERINPKRIDNMELVKVFDGYQTYIEEGIVETYKKAGLKYVWTGIPDADDIVKIIQSPGLLSNNNRFKAGMKRTGASPVEDFRTGGSDSVFTRIGVKNKNNPRFDDSYRGNRYRILIDPKEMERTDWYAFDYDQYGTSDTAAMAGRPSPLDFIKQMATTYRSGNEIMFRQGIAKESFIGISCQSNSLRAELLEKFKEAHITKVNGIPIEDFVKVGSTI